MRKKRQKEFIEDFKISDSAMRNLILGSEIVTDIGNHILAEAFKRTRKNIPRL